MANVLANASRLKPEIRLAQAVSQFEADLSNDQKAAFRRYKSQIQDAPPDHRDVMRLTAEFDLGATRKLGGGRCYGPRMMNFLYSVQQFAAIGDVMVGGSQNLIACGVWSLVRMSLLSIVNFSSYLDKISSLFMSAGRSAPRYQNIATLYSRSQHLQSHLAEYFVVVVGLCHMVFRFTQKSIAGQFLSSLNDSELRKYQSDLDTWANSIKEEVGMLSAEKIEEEAQENTRFRALFRKSSKAISLEPKLRTRQEVLDLCSTFDYETPWKQIRKVGKATFFYREPAYQDWRGHAESCTLLCIGKLGSGKSVMLANIVDDLNVCVDSRNFAVAYFFCRHDIPESLTARIILMSLARQLLLSVPDLPRVAESLDYKALALDFEAVLNLLQRAFQPTHKAYFILDGLDECEYSERRKAIAQIRNLQKNFKIILCVSFRLEPDNTLKLRSEDFAAPRSISIPEDNPDIKLFIDTELENCIVSQRLVMGDPTVILEIREALLRMSQGMFLWVALQIPSLCAMKTDHAIRQALEDLPRDLSETFARILARPEATGSPYQKLILELVTVARNPLEIEQLREALSVVPGDIDWNPAKLLNDVYSVLAYCGSLLIIDEEALTVRFVHPSVKQFLLNNSTNMGFTTAEAHRTMSNIIVTYLNYGIFETQLATTVVPKIMTGPAPARILRSNFDASSSIGNIALKLLKSKRTPNYDVGPTLVEASKFFKNPSDIKHYFHSYAISSWQHHILFASEPEPLVNSLWLRLLKKRTIDQIITDEYDQTLLLQAVKQGKEAVVKLLLEVGKADVEACDTQYGQTPLTLAAGNGHEAVVKLLLEVGKADVDARYKGGYETPLTLAARNGREAIVKLLLEVGKADVEARDKGGQTPLSWAAKNGHEAVVKLLLEVGKADVEARDIFGQTPLSWATKNGYEAIVKLLLEVGKADVEAQDRDGQTPLSWAVKNGHDAVVKLLLDVGKADVEAQDKHGGTPLSLATQYGDKSVVKLLRRGRSEPLS